MTSDLQTIETLKGLLEQVTAGPLVVSDGSLDRSPGDEAPRWEVHVPNAQTTAYCRKEADARLYAAAAATLPRLLQLAERGMQEEWQDIASAPKDRTAFIGYCTKSGRVLVEQHYEGETLFTETWAIDRRGRMEADPHLWRPLPAPPASKEGV